MKLSQAVTDLELVRTHMERIVDEQIVFGFDIETGYDGDDREKAAVNPELMKVVGISYAMDTDEGFYVPIAHDLAENVDLAELAEIMKPALQSGLGVAHNAKFERRCLRQPQPRGFGYDCRVRSDTQIEAYVLQQWQGFGLKALVATEFGYEQATYASLFPGAKPAQIRKSRFNHLPVSPAVVQYAVDDSIWCLALHLRHYPKVCELPVFKLEMEVLDVVVAMEEAGLFYDWDYLRDGAEGCLEFVGQLEAELLDQLSEMAGTRIEINLASPAQLADVLYEQLGLPVSMRSKKTDKPSTGADALTPLARDYPVVKKILWWKELKKLHGTYLKKYETAYSGAADGRTHPNTMQAVVVSGRFAVSDPPYQQTPKKYQYALDNGAHWEFEFRPAIKPQPGNYFLYFDYSQVELRVVAGLANEQALIDAFSSGTDVHRVTASLMLNVPFDQVTGDQRDIGKAQPLSEPVLTPDGWKRMRDIAVGDWLVGRSGEPVQVQAVHPQGPRPVWEVEFDDGEVVRCDPDHLWTVHHRNQVLAGVRTTAQLAPHVNQGARVRTPGISPVQRPEVPVLIHPYLLGMLLGDGSFRMGTPTFSSEDRELLSRVEDLVPEGVQVRRVQTDRCPTLSLSSGAGRSANPLVEALRLYGLMGPSTTGRPGWGASSHEKFIPEIYIQGSVEQRQQLLQGLLDTDGSVSGQAAVEFSTVSATLAHDVAEVARSLGARVKISKRTTRCQTGEFDAFRLYITGLVEPFRLARKRDRYRVSGRHYQGPAMVAIRDTGLVEESVCFEVDGQHYITKSYKLTHNTMNFALVYGMSTKMLAQRLAVSQERAEELYQAYFDTYGSIKVWRQRVIEEAAARGYTVSWLGRKHKIWEFDSNDRWVFEKGERLAGNAPVQGGAADYMKVAMVRQHKKLDELGLLRKVRAVANVHDSLTWEVSDGLDPYVLIQVLNPCVSFPLKGFPPITADWAIGLDWGNLHEIELAEALESKVPVTVYSVLGAPQEPQPAPEVPAPTEPINLPSAAFTRPVITAGEGDGIAALKALVVTFSEMPTAEQWQAFVGWTRTNRGECELRVVTPKGTVELPEGVSPRAHPEHAQALLGGRGRVEWEVFEETKDLLATGLGL